MTINRRQLFTEAWALARKQAKKRGSPVRQELKLALSVMWALVKEEARKAALPPPKPNAWTMGTAVYNWGPASRIRHSTKNSHAW